jgi:hypothetical protein
VHVTCRAIQCFTESTGNITSSYNIAQLDEMHGILATNIWLSYSQITRGPRNLRRYDTVSKLGVNNARAHLEGLFPEGIPLQTAFVAPTLIQQLDAAVEEALESNSWVDCLPLVPSVLSATDAVDLLARCPSVKALGEDQTPRESTVLL